MFYCVGLVHLNKEYNKILVVKSRENKKFYLAGGKIEKNESPIQALIREIKEELDVDIIEDSIKYLKTIISDAYPQTNKKVKLVCYSANWIGEVSPQAEISEVSYIDVSEKNMFAPAVNQLLDELNLN